MECSKEVESLGRWTEAVIKWQMEGGDTDMGRQNMVFTRGSMRGHLTCTSSSWLRGSCRKNRKASSHTGQLVL